MRRSDGDLRCLRLDHGGQTADLKFVEEEVCDHESYVEGIPLKGQVTLPGEMPAQLSLQRNQVRLRRSFELIQSQQVRVDTFNDRSDMCSPRDRSDIGILNPVAEGQGIVDDLLFGEMVVNTVSDSPEQIVCIDKGANQAKCVLVIVTSERLNTFPELG